MPWNPALNIVTISGTIQLTNSSAAPASGYIRFTNDYTLTDAAGNIVSGPVDEKVFLSNGAFTIDLPANDAAGIAPSGWSYHASVNTTAYDDEFDFLLPSTPTTVNWADIVPLLTPAAPSGTYAPFSEVAARIAADAALQVNINAEMAARIAADLVLQANIDAETAARIAADAVLQANITVVDGFVQNCLTRVAAIENGTATLAALHVAPGNADIAGTLDVTGRLVSGGKNFFQAFKPGGVSTYTGQPVTGTWEEGDIVIDIDARVWRCLVAGTPGTWVGTP